MNLFKHLLNVFFLLPLLSLSENQVAPKTNSVPSKGQSNPYPVPPKPKDGVYPHKEDVKEEEYMVVYGKGEVDTLAKYPGGNNAMWKYLHDSLRYDKTAMENCITGLVWVDVLIDEKGNITNAKIADSNAKKALIETEALRLVNNMPQWKPAKLNGKPVSQEIKIPVKFELEKCK